MIKVEIPNTFLIDRLDLPQGMRLAAISPSLSRKDTIEAFFIGDGTHDVKEMSVE